MSSNLATNEPLMKKYTDYVAPEYERFKSDRDQNVKPHMKTGDNMYQCMQNRAIEPQEREKGTNTTVEPRAETGSTLYFRHCNQFAAEMVKFAGEMGDIARYTPTTNHEVFDSMEQGARQAAKQQTSLTWAWHKDKMPQRLLDFGTRVAKYGNIAIQIIWEKKEKRVLVKPEKSGGKPVKKTVTEQMPHIRILPWESVYGDFYGGDIERQRVLVIETEVTLHELAMRKKEWEPTKWDEFLKSGQKYQSGGGVQQEEKQDRADARDEEYAPDSTGKFIMRDVYAWVPINGNAWKDGEAPTLWWSTLIGDDLNSAIPLRMETDFDPDGEIPVLMAHLWPDDDNRLYHIFSGSISRSLYSARCTFLNLAIDNTVNINDPKKVVNRNLMESVDFEENTLITNGPVDQAIKYWAPADTTNQTANLMGLLEAEWRLAQAIDLNDTGQAYGQRTSASEVLRINNAAPVARNILIGYVLWQLGGWYARKVQSYLQAYAPEEAMFALTDEPHIKEVRLEEMWGDFDVKVDVLSHIESNLVMANKAIQFVQLVGSSPSLMRSRTHEFYPGEAIKSIAMWMGIPEAGRWIGPGRNGDAIRTQRLEISRMQNEGEWTDPQPDEDHQIHAEECDIWLAKWEPVKEEAEIKPIHDMVLRHRDLHRQMLAAEGTAQGGSPEAPPPDQTPGQEAGGEIAGALGGGAPV
jgi:hypothetical protein